MVLRNQTAEDSSPLIKYLPADQWIDGSSADSELPKYSAASFRLTTTNGAYASFSFNGTGAWIYGAKRANHGPYKCSLDGTDQPLQYGYSDPNNNQISVALCSALNLKMGPHVMTITNLWNNSALPYLDVDYVIWETEISDEATQSSILLDDTDATIQYTPQGEWSENQCQNMAAYSANSCHITGSNTAQASLTFQGDAIAIYGGVGPQYGPYQVTLDNQQPALFTANSTNLHTQQIIYFASGLGAGNHTVVIKNNPASVGNKLDVDYVQVLGAGIPTSGSNSGGSDNNSSGGSSKVGPIVGGVVGAIALIALGLGLFFWLRRKHAAKNRDDLDLGENDKSGSDVAMANAVPTPYVVPAANRNHHPNGSNVALATNMSNQSVSMPQPQHLYSDNPNRPYTGYGTQYTLSDGHPDTPMGDAFASPGHRAQQPSATYSANTFGGAGASASSSNGHGSSRAGNTSSSGVSPGPPATRGEKAAHLYVGPTVRNEPEQVADAPPLYTR
ncbi:hypothetical protein FRB90_000021 [Tulasnella sp. 427]|nr:hypothetical protein FRB90_000021 [Tulasnella sp. 427]